MTESMFEDLEMFTCEVNKNPEIWNITAEYHNWTKKRGVWISICRVFCEVIGAQFFSTYFLMFLNVQLLPADT